MAKNKVRAKDLKKQRWAAVVAAVLALGMLLSLVGVYINQAIGGGNDASAVPGQPTEPQPEDYLNYYKEEVQRLEAYLNEHDPTIPVLLELAENYRYLVFIQQVFFEDEAAVETSQQNLTSVFADLIKMEPDNLSHRLEMLNLQLEMGNEDAATDQIAFLTSQLREEPNPVVHLSLINIMVSSGITSGTEEEIAWIYDYLTARVESGEADNTDRFYLAVIYGEYKNDPDTATAMLEDILAAEEEGSQVYQDALSYFEYLQSANVADVPAPE